MLPVKFVHESALQYGDANDATMKCKINENDFENVISIPFFQIKKFQAAKLF